MDKNFKIKLGNIEKDFFIAMSFLLISIGATLSLKDFGFTGYSIFSTNNFISLNFLGILFFVLGLFILFLSLKKLGKDI